MEDDLYFTSLEKRLIEEKVNRGWILSPGFFGESIDMWDFEPRHYVYFVDSSDSRKKLLRGLGSLTPFADDAFDVARRMTKDKFCEFRRLLSYERKTLPNEKSHISSNYFPLIIPKRFIRATELSRIYGAPLGSVLIHLADVFCKGLGKK